MTALDTLLRAQFYFDYILMENRELNNYLEFRTGICVVKQAYRTTVFSFSLIEQTLDPMA